MSADDRKTQAEKLTRQEESSDPKPSTPLEKKSPAQEAAEEARKPHVFKFAPVDPKNNLEFEDMADK